MLRLFLLTTLLAFVATTPAPAASRSVTFPERYDSYVTSGSFAYTPEQGSAQVSFRFKSAPTYDFQRNAPQGWQGGDFILLSRKRYEKGSVIADIYSDSVSWSVTGYSGSLKVPFAFSPDGLTMTSTFSSPAIKNLKIASMGLDSYFNEPFSFWPWESKRLLAPLTPVQLDLQYAQSLAAAKVKQLAKRKTYELQSNSCRLPISNIGICRATYKIGSQRWGVNVYLDPDMKAALRGSGQWTVTSSKPSKLAPLLPVLPTG